MNDILLNNNFDPSYLIGQKLINLHWEIDKADEQIGLEFEDGSIFWIGFSSQEGSMKLFNIPLKILQKHYYIPEIDKDI